MHRRSGWTIGILTGWILLTGCQSFTLRPQTVQEEKVSEIVIALSAKLNQDKWSFNQDWQVEKLLHTPELIGKPRWQFQEENTTRLLGQLQKEELLLQSIEEVEDEPLRPDSEIDKSAEVKEPELSSSALAENQSSESDSSTLWNGFLPGQLTGNATKQEFRKLVSQGGLIGWNAAIIWAKRDPSGAVEVVPLLEKLAAEPQYYDPRTGRAVRPPRLVRGQNDVSTADSIDVARSKELIKSGMAQLIDSTKKSETAKPVVPENKKKQVSDALRASAAEALCQVLLAQGEEPIDALAPVGRMLEKSTLPNLVRIECYMGLARWAPPENIPSLNNALRENSVSSGSLSRFRMAAYDACILHAYWNQYLKRQPDDFESPVSSFDAAVWPAAVHQASQSRDSRVQQKYCLWLALAQPPEAFSRLKRYTQNQNGKTKSTAYLSMGHLNTSEAVSFLQDAGQSRNINERVGAVQGLGVYGAQYLGPYLSDPEVKVKVAVAHELARTPSPLARHGLTKLLRDKSVSVHRAVTGGVNHWSDELVLPLLIEGMVESPQLSTRQACLLQVQQRTGSDETVLVNAGLKERRLHVMNWAKKQNLPVSRGLDHSFVLAHDSAHEEGDLRRREITVLLEKLDDSQNDPEGTQDVVDQLAMLGSQEIYLLEQELANHSSEVGTVVYREVMPVVHPAYRGIKDLSAPLVETRRQAARNLSVYAQRASLPEQVVRELVLIMVSEQDHEVWRYVMQAVMRDGTALNASVARLAVNNGWPDVRLLGCQYIEKYPQPEYAEWLRPLLTDLEPGVQIKAIQVVGLCRNPSLIKAIPGNVEPDAQNKNQGLENLLQTTDARLRFEVLVAMTRLGDWQAIRELVAMGRHPDDQVRKNAILAIGSSGQSRLIDSLLMLGQREENRHIQQIILQKIEELAPLGTQLPTNYPRLPYDRKLAVWRTAMSTKSAMATTSPSVPVLR